MAAFFAEAAQRSTSPATRTVQKRRGVGKWVFLALLLATTGTLGYLYRDSRFISRITGSGYADVRQLQLRAYPRPDWAGYEFELTTWQVVFKEPDPVDQQLREHSKVDFGKVKSTTVTASAIELPPGAPGERNVRTATVLVDPTFIYSAGASPTDPWRRRPHDPAQDPASQLRADLVYMQQDFVDQSLLAVRPVSQISEVVEGRHDVVTYRWLLTIADLPETAPLIAGHFPWLLTSADENDAIAVTMSVDLAGVIWLLDVDIDSAAVVRHGNSGPDSGTVMHHYRYQLVVGSAEGFGLTAPTNTVDVVDEAGEAST